MNNATRALARTIYAACQDSDLIPTAAEWREIVTEVRASLGNPVGSRQRHRWADSSMYGTGAKVRAVYKKAGEEPKVVDGELREWIRNRPGKGWARIAVIGATFTGRVLAPEEETEE